MCIRDRGTAGCYTSPCVALATENHPRPAISRVEHRLHGSWAWLTPLLCRAGVSTCLLYTSDAADDM
eukprot:10462784-Alexandrium_andersonii.AAC.1